MRLHGRVRAVVTGLGVVTPIGQTVPAFWRNSLAGRSGVRRISRFLVPPRLSGIAGVIEDFDPIERFGGAAAQELDRVTQLALAASDEAVNDAGVAALLRSDQKRARTGVFLSTAIAQIGGTEIDFSQRTAGGSRPLTPLARGAAAVDDRFGAGGLRARLDFNTSAEAVARRFGCLRGGVTITTGCTGGLDALGAAMAALRRGEVDLALVGAAEAPITPLVVAAFGRIGATSLRNDDPTRASRPFDADRDGFVLGEGAAMLVLESLEHAEGRGAHIYGELAGYASVNNCYHMTDIPEDGRAIARSARLALADAGIDPGAVDAINAHGSSTPQNDVAEAGAYHSLFGARGRDIPVTSIKSQTGHPLAASNTIECVSALLTLGQGLIPPTINLTRKDPRCALDVVTGEPRYGSFQCVLKTSSGFSGIHSSLILRRHEGRTDAAA